MSLAEVFVSSGCKGLVCVSWHRTAMTEDVLNKLVTVASSSNSSNRNSSVRYGGIRRRRICHKNKKNI